MKNNRTDYVAELDTAAYVAIQFAMRDLIRDRFAKRHTICNPDTMRGIIRGNVSALRAMKKARVVW